MTFFNFIFTRTVWSPLLMAASWSWTDGLSAPTTSTPDRARCAAGAASPSRVAASRRSARSFTPNTLFAPSACGRSDRASTGSRRGRPTVRPALTNSLCESSELRNRSEDRNREPVEVHLVQECRKLQSSLPRYITCDTNHYVTE